MYRLIAAAVLVFAIAVGGYTRSYSQSPRGASAGSQASYSKAQSERGKVVYGAGEFAALAPPPPPVLPEWSPVRAYGGYHQPCADAAGTTHAHACSHTGWLQRLYRLAGGNRGAREPLWGLGCECFAL